VVLVLPVGPIRRGKLLASSRSVIASQTQRDIRAVAEPVPGCDDQVTKIACSLVKSLPRVSQTWDFFLPAARPAFRGTD